MLKIITVLATTFLFAGLLIAHPYTSPGVEPAAGLPAKLATTAPAQGVAAEATPAPSKTTVVGPTGGNADTSGTIAALPQLEQPRVQTPKPPSDNRYAALNAGAPGSRTPAPVAVPPLTLSPAPASLNASAGPRRDRVRWPQPTDLTSSRIDPPPASPGVRIVFARPMPLEERIHLAHANRTYRP
jgi:hypothetical protein